MLLGFFIPFQSALLSVEEMNNTMWLISFVAFLTMVFVGYVLVDSSYPKPSAPSENAGH